MIGSLLLDIISFFDIVSFYGRVRNKILDLDFLHSVTIKLWMLLHAIFCGCDSFFKHWYSYFSSYPFTLWQREIDNDFQEFGVYEWTKHIEIDCHFNHRHFQQGTITLSVFPYVDCSSIYEILEFSLVSFSIWKTFNAYWCQIMSLRGMLPLKKFRTFFLFWVWCVQKYTYQLLNL